ncbi:MAG TPA: hypothetical protein PK413_14570, partial [Thermoanaerobaculia bacterium]|nr:hypothetical protein [Thermoanaerobaculia bacterium]
MVVLPAGSLSGVWNKLVTLLRQNEGLDTFPRLARWAQAQLLAFQSQKGPAERQRSAVLLRILAECLPADPAARQNQFTEELARLFQQPLSPEEFLPVLQPLRKIIRGWQEGEPGSYAQALDRIYSQLPYTLQELVDVELARHALVASRSERLDAPTSIISTQDATAYLELLGDWRTSREDLKAKPRTEPIALLSIHTEEWLQAFVLHRAVPCPERGPARARVARAGEALLLQGGRLLAFRPDNPAGLEDLTPPGWFEPRAFATVDPSGQSGSPVLILGEEDRLGWADLPAEGGAPSQVVAWNLEAEGRLRHAVPAGQGRLLVVSESEGSEAAWPQLLLLSFRERRVLARGSLPYRCPKELCLLAADSETWLLVADTRDEEVGLVQVRLTASSSLQVTVTASRAVRGRIRSIACARSKAEPARVFVGTANGY